jgi:hypothetical protein
LYGHRRHVTLAAGLRLGESMAFTRKTVSVVGWVGIVVSVVAGLVVGGIVYSGEAEDAAAAQRMLKEGVTVKAVPTYASASTTKRRRGGSSTTYTIRYAFPDPQMRRVDGQDLATQAEYSALIDPNNSSVIRRGATVDVVYDRINPSKNGLKSRFESESSPDFWNIVLAFVLMLGVALLIVWGIYAFMKKRVAPDAAATPAPAWQPPPTG